MIINDTTLKAAEKNYRALFFKALEGNNQLELLALCSMIVQSSSPSETYAWLGEIPEVKEWIGERDLGQLAAEGFRIDNKPYATGFKVLREEYEFDKLGLVRPRVDGLGDAFARHPMKLILTLIAAGMSATAYDGKAFFATDHAFGSNKQTEALDATSYGISRKMLRQMKNDRSVRLSLTPTHLLVAEALEGTALELLRAETISGTTNKWKNTAELVVMPFETDTEWYLADLSRPVKPFIFQRVGSPSFAAMDRNQDQNVFLRREFWYGGDYMAGAGYGLPQLIIGSTGTT